MESSVKTRKVKKSYKKIFLEEGDVIYLIHNQRPIWRFVVRHRSGKYVHCDNNVSFFYSMHGGIEIYRGLTFNYPRTFQLETPELKAMYWRYCTIRQLSDSINYEELSDKQLYALHKFVKQLKSIPESHEKENINVS